MPGCVQQRVWAITNVQRRALLLCHTNCSTAAKSSMKARMVRVVIQGMMQYTPVEDSLHVHMCTCGPRTPPARTVLSSVKLTSHDGHGRTSQCWWTGPIS